MPSYLAREDRSAGGATARAASWGCPIPAVEWVCAMAWDSHAVAQNTHVMARDPCLYYTAEVLRHVGAVVAEDGETSAATAREVAETIYEEKP